MARLYSHYESLVLSAVMISSSMTSKEFGSRRTARTEGGTESKMAVEIRISYMYYYYYGKLKSCCVARGENVSRMMVFDDCRDTLHD